MSNYVIITDANTDFNQELVSKCDVKVIPMKYILDEVTYDNDLTGDDKFYKDFYRMLKDGAKASTVQINVIDFIEAFEPYLTMGKDVIYISFSSGLSGTYHSAFLAKKELDEKYPDRKIIVVDSLAASMGEGLLVYLASQKRNAGFSIEELETWVIENRDKVCQWFTVDDLHHLKRGGRVSATTAVVGTMLAIKPILHVDAEGHLVSADKVRGRKASLDALVKKIVGSIDSESESVFISHGDCLEDAEYVKKQIMSKTKIKEVIITFIGPVIGSHSGPGTVAAFYMGNER